ncbi:MAG TPA: hypothetical protein VFY29_05250 [Terriglobia bacterium]|nr:hypothetical protein [Terriglobia bacterium]
MRRSIYMAWLLIFCAAGWSYAQSRPFPIKYISSDVVYLEGGTAAGLKEGMHLEVKRPGPGESAPLAPSLAELVVISVASTSAACEIVRTDVTLQAGDQAFVAPEDLKTQSAASLETETYSQIVEFNDGDPLDQELRERVPKPPLPEVNRFGGRIGFDQDVILNRSASGQNSSQQGISLRFDLTRIGSSYWSIGGYWRIRVSSRKRADDQQSISDLLQRVYQFGLRYDNPQSRYVIGVGRVIVPWASSLSAVDGGYLGARVRRSLTVGGFAGSSPDPTAWNYDPGRQLGGAFASLDAGRFEQARYTTTAGIAVSRLNWKPERQFLFVENGILIKRKFSFHHNVEVDYQSLNAFASADRIALTRSFATARIQPLTRLTFDISHNYFRVFPTPDERLIATGQLDNLLFQGLNAGVTVDLGHGWTVYANGNRSSRTEDRAPSWNRMGGITWNIPKAGLRAEARYSRFSGTVGAGRYRSFSLRKDARRWRLELEGGDQQFESLALTSSRAWYSIAGADTFVGRFVFGFRGTRYRGTTQNYDQLRANLDFRF